ncbi:MAG: endonuclease [Clostridiales bacterium]|nr:endonuclease [Clostridiales bacterium]
MKKFFNMIAVYLAAVFTFCSVVGCAADRAPTSSKPKIDTPVVTISSDGVVTWDEVGNALYYVYVIDEGEENMTVDCRAKSPLYHNESIKVMAVSGSEQYSDSDFSTYKTYIQSAVLPTQPTKLGTPQVAVNASGVATWNAIDNAQYYIYVIDNGAEVKTTERIVTLANNQSIKVKAGSDDESYVDSDFSQLKTYANGSVQTTLNTPQVTIDNNGVASWNSISGAEYYVYIIDNGTGIKTTNLSVTLANNQTIAVKACNDDEDCIDSDYSQPKTYTKVVPQPTKLGTPQVSISTQGVATWGSVANAQYYYYVVNGGVETKTTERSVQLSENQNVKVKAGSDSKDYVDSDYSQLKTYVKIVTPDLPAEVQAYYSVITATSGNSLLGQVHDLITTTHTYYTSYGECSESRYVNVTDPGPNGGALEFYTQKSIMSFSGSLGDWNREHVWCKSLSNGMWKSVSNGTRNGGTDMHHIRPAECGLNSTRSSYKFGIVNDGKEAWSRNSDKQNVALGGYVGGGAFEPLDKVKGDVARIVFYVYVHYNTYANVHGTTNGKGGAFGTLNFTNIMSPNNESAAIRLLLEWNASDPVDEIERVRNNEVYKIQGNRNPFIDHPEYANAIWG